MLGGGFLRNIIIIVGKLFFILKHRKLSEKPIKKILIIRSGGIGDVLMSTPLVATIKKHYPDANITYMVGNWSKNVLENNPNVNTIYSYDDLDIIHFRLSRIRKIIKDMKKEKFDLAFCLEKSWHWSLLTFMFKAKRRIGFDRYGEGFANNLNVPFKGEKYELEYYLDLARKISLKPVSEKIEIHLTKKEKDFSEFFLYNMNLDKKKLIGIAPGGADNPAQQASIKRWPLKKYVELIKALPDYHFLLFGGKNDIETCKSIDMNTKNSTFLAGKLTLKESASLIDQCKYFITHDSGPMHLASATGTKLIALFGPTQSKRFAPKNAIVINAGTPPCYTIYGLFKPVKENQMDEIKIEDVLKEIK